VSEQSVSDALLGINRQTGVNKQGRVVTRHPKLAENGTWVSQEAMPECSAWDTPAPYLPSANSGVPCTTNPSCDAWDTLPGDMGGRCCHLGSQPAKKLEKVSQASSR
jgi:hypothetical protein